MKEKKRVICTNRNHMAAFKYSIEPDAEIVDECEYEPVVVERRGWVDSNTITEEKDNGK